MLRTFLYTIGLLAVAMLATSPAAASFGDASDASMFSTLAGLAGVGIVAFGMACTTEIGAALRRGGCGNAPSPRGWSRIDQPDATRAAPNLVVQTRWQGAGSASRKGKDSRVEDAYIKSIAIRGNVLFTTGATNSLVTAHLMRSIFYNIKLKDCTGHSFFDGGIDGRDIVDDCYYRHGRLPQALPGVVGVNLGAGSHTVAIDLEIPLGYRAVGQDPREGLIPLATLQTADLDAFSFQCRSVLPSPGGVAVPGFTSIDSFTRPDGTAGLEIWAEIAWIPRREDGVPYWIDAPWMLRNYVLQGNDVALNSDDRKHIYAHVRYRAEDTFGSPNGVTGQQLASLIDNMQCEVGGLPVFQPASLRTIDLAVRSAELKAEGVTSFGDSADALGLAPLTLPAEAGVTTPDVYMQPWRASDDAPAGPYLINMQTQPATSTRFLHRTVGCVNAERAKTILAAMSCGCAVNVLTANGQQEPGTPVMIKKA